MLIDDFEVEPGDFVVIRDLLDILTSEDKSIVNVFVSENDLHIEVF